ncbi:MAG: VWA domain-containing protein, partial [Candidatus Hydrogenedentes bacterium]|nr:VWA domain-containing protein [Candidatus Hydrogenedentota bacterium]
QELISTLNATGAFSAYIENVDPEGPGGRDIIVRVKSDNDRTRVFNANTGDTYYLNSGVHVDLADGASTQIDLTADNVGTSDRAFSVLDALTTVTDHTGDFLGGLLAKIDVDFPTSDSTSNYSDAKLHIRMDDWIDWDVIHHEYGHYFMIARNIEKHPGGDHALDENLAERIGKDQGIRMAWGEGFPTYYGTSAQDVQGASNLHIPNVGDTKYTDTIDTTNDYSLEESAGVLSIGEDNEISVQRILWDLYDSNSDGEDDVSLDVMTIYGAAAGVNASTLSQFWNGLIAVEGTTMKHKVAYGCIFGEHYVAPKLTTPVNGVNVGASHTPVRFAWEANGAGLSFLLNKFRVQFWKHDFSSMIFESPELDVTSYTPSSAEWATIFATEKIVRWVVAGRNTASPETGAYISCSRRLGGPDLAFVIDDTGSMDEEIRGVRRALTQFIEFLRGPKESSVAIELITFKDDVTSVITSDDLDAVQAAVRALYASQGGTCPEASVEALNYAAGSLKPGAPILLVTDASAHSGLNIGATIAALRAKGIRVNVMLSGSCTERFKSGDDSQLPSSENCEPCGDGAKVDYPYAAIALFTTIAAETGGIYAFVPDVNDFTLSGATRYENTAFNVMRAVAWPSLPTVNPPIGHQGTTFAITLTGANTNFNPSSVLSFTGSGITVNGTATNSPISYTANITIAPDADLGFRDVAVTTSLSKAANEEAVGIGAFQIKGVLADPTVVGVAPAEGVVGSTLDVEVFGANTHFDATSTVDFDGITVNSVTPLSETSLLANITIAPDATLGYRSVLVATGAENATESVPGPFIVAPEIIGGFPRLVAVTPFSVTRGQVLNVQVVGENTTFVDGSSVGSISGGGVAVLSTVVTDATHTTLSVQVDAAAALGFRDVLMTTDAEVAAILDAFEIRGPILTANAGPDQTIYTNDESAEVTLDGSGSTRAEFAITGYQWTGTPDPDDVVSPVVTVPHGTHVFTLIVTDGSKLVSAPDTVTILVREPTGIDADIDADGNVNAVDVQLVINAALGINIGGLDADVNLDSNVDAVDVQLVINAALGIIPMK